MPLKQLGLAQVGQNTGMRQPHHVVCAHRPLRLAVHLCRSTPSLVDAFRLEAGAVGAPVSASLPVHATLDHPEASLLRTGPCTCHAPSGRMKSAPRRAPLQADSKHHLSAHC